jgi:hypothetical protein
MDRMLMQGSWKLLSHHGCILSILTSCLPPFFRQDERDGQDIDAGFLGVAVTPQLHPVHPDILSSFTKTDSHPTHPKVCNAAFLRGNLPSHRNTAVVVKWQTQGT